MDRKPENIKIEFPAKNDAKKERCKKNVMPKLHFFTLIIFFLKSLISFLFDKWDVCRRGYEAGIRKDLNSSILHVCTKQSRGLPSSIMTPQNKIHPDLVLRHIAIKTGGECGDRHYPFLHFTRP